MSNQTTGSASTLAADAAATVHATPLARVVDLTARAATSWIGLLTAYIGAVSAAVYAFRKLAEPLAGWPLWARVALVAALPVLVFAFHTIPALVEQRRKRRLSEITGTLQAGYFRLAPREDEESFRRADGKHEEILEWLTQRDRAKALYLTGASGSGKSSLLAAWVLPHLERQGTTVIRLRGYQDPLVMLEEELRKPGVIWQRRSTEKAGDLSKLLSSASQHIRPRRLLVVLDQFEEFVILQDTERQQRFEQFFLALLNQSDFEVTFLLVFRSDYIGLIEKLSLPPLMQDTNWKEIPPFTERAAKDFMRGSGLEVNEEVLSDVLREAAEIEQARGLIRPITINLCGLVLGRFASGLPRGFRPGALIRGFLKESIFHPAIREVSPQLIPQLISGYVTKRPRTVTDLATNSRLDPGAVRGCLRFLGQSDRAIVRPLDADQKTWEISHDFLVPLLDSITANWRTSFWRRSRPWLPWIGVAVLALTAFGVSTWRKDPIRELTDMGWRVEKTDKGLHLSYIKGPPPKGSLSALMRTGVPLTMTLTMVDESVLQWRDVNLTTLDLSDTGVSNIEPLRELKNLTTLNLRGTGVTSIDPLRELKNLTRLDLSGTDVEDVEPLRELKNLTEFFVTNTQVRSIESLTDLKNLTNLDLRGNKVSDIKPLRELKNLTSLNLDGTGVGNIEPLRELKNLTFLDLGSTRVTNIEPLRDLKNLTLLDLSFTQVINVEALRDLKNLTTLHLGGTGVGNIKPLRDLKNLTELGLNGTRVTNVEPLRELKNLTTLYLHNMKISEAAINGLKNANPKLHVSTAVHGF